MKNGNSENEDLLEFIPAKETFEEEKPDYTKVNEIIKKIVTNKLESQILEYYYNGVEVKLIAEFLGVSTDSNGYRARVIAENLNELGYHRIDGKSFDEKYVLYILHNSRYTGIVEHHGVVYDKIFPRIIDDILWNKVNAINEENKLAPSRKKEIYDYILSSKLICGVCNHRMFGESGTSHTKEIHYYYSCASKRKKRCECNKKSIQKQYLEDIVINAISKLLGTEQNIEYLATRIFECNQNRVNDNTTLKLLERHKKDIYKASQNIIKAIEQGIITDMTKERLQQLETQLAEIEIEINKEKIKDYSLLSKEEIEQFLRKQVFEDMSDIKIRKLVINTFVRQIYLYEDKIIILFNFATPPDKPKLTVEENIKTAEQITSALSKTNGSCIKLPSAPKNSPFGTFYSPESGIFQVSLA